MSSITRRSLMGMLGAAGAATLIPTAPAQAQAQPRPRPGAIPFFGVHQAGIAEPPQANLCFASIRANVDTRAGLRGLLADWTDAAAAMTRGLPIGRATTGRDAVPVDTGEALDLKTPLLRSMEAISRQAVRILRLFGDATTERVITTMGPEQEYFLVDRDLYLQRPDLVQTGRTLFGRSPAKHQQLEDQYFGNIPERAFAFMAEFEEEAYKLGIPLKTRHNEVAPNQFECAPVFEEANLAVDHNQLLMDIMKRVARKHNFRILLHEKPYKGINGSGKHNNWSMLTNTGVNLLAPGINPKSNLQFLTFIINTVKAVHDYADLLRASVMSAGNEHRLGAHEAPPAIISVFIGQHLTRILQEIEDKVPASEMTPDQKTELKLDIGKIPQILLDNTDRNRTSPFAFTGNRFEFRAVGSSMNCAAPMTILNTVMANQLKEFKAEVDELIEQGSKKDEAIFRVLRKYIIHSKKILQYKTWSHPKD